MNVLIVDDEPVILRMMTSMLECQGFRVIGVSTGIDALAVSREHPIDVLVTDIEMTGIDGLTLAKLLVERYPDLPVVFTSGYPMTDLGTNRHRFLLKPFKAMELIDTLSELVGETVSAKRSGQSCAAVSR